MKKQIKKYTIGFILSVVLLAIFLFIGSQVKGLSSGIYFDRQIISSISDMVTPNIKEFMRFISFLGSTKFYIPLYIIVIFYFLKNKNSISAMISVNGVLGSAIVNFLVKRYYGRIRPEDFFQIQETGLSFPSGHSMVAISSYFVLTYLLFRNKPWNFKKVIAWTFSIILVFSIGISRIYLGVHWPTDVIAGFSLGFIWFYINAIIIERLDR